MTVYSKIKKEHLEQISALTNDYRLMLWQELVKINLADFNDFLRENSQYVRSIDLKNMTYLCSCVPSPYYANGSGFYKADFSKMSLNNITEVFNQLERYAS